MAGTVLNTISKTSGNKVVTMVVFQADTNGFTHTMTGYKGYYLYQVKVKTESSAGSYDLQFLTDYTAVPAGGSSTINLGTIDLLGGSGNGRNSSSDDVIIPSPSYPVLGDSFTITISNGFGNTVKGMIELVCVP